MSSFENQDCSLHDNPDFHRHAEATTAELFYDLFFVANLTTFTSLNDINDHNSLTAYIGFFSLLWLTWYQVSLYDVRFSSDSLFERVAKALHFGTMVGFAVIGVSWKPGQKVADFSTYKAFGLILLVSRFTLFCQYGVTLLYAKKYKKTVIPLALIMASTLIAAILYGALSATFPKVKWVSDGLGNLIVKKQENNTYIAWYVIGLSEIILTVTVSCVWRVISFKGTHMVQRMTLLSLIILGEGIIVICKSISKIIKNDYLWTAAVAGQIISAILIIYFLYMLYFDRVQEEHFGSIKQQIWSFLHFPLHTTLVLVLQGVSLLVVWLQAIIAFNYLYIGMNEAIAPIADFNYTSGEEFAMTMNHTVYSQVYNYVPKGVDASKEIKSMETTIYSLWEAYDYFLEDHNNKTAAQQIIDGYSEAFSLATKTLFDSLSVSIPKDPDAKVEKKLDPDALVEKYVNVFVLVFSYVFVAVSLLLRSPSILMHTIPIFPLANINAQGGLALLIITMLGFLSLPARERKISTYIRLGFNAICGLALCLIATIRFNETEKLNYLTSPWMIPTLCLVYFFCVVVNHVRIPGKSKAH